ncbi:MAG TPA: TonB-dependent receptor [Rubricoccaceae bacterium]
MSRLLAALLLAALVPPAAAQGPPPARAATVVLSGVVTDGETGEALIGATVAAPDLGRGVATNAFGHYSLSVPVGEVRLVVRYVGYAPRRETLALAADRAFDVALQPDGTLGEAVVEADADAQRRPEDTPQMGQVALTGRDVRGMPALLGETDVLKALQTLPGVRGGAEGTAGIYVRGGSPDQTLILLDGVPVYNANHLFGFLSVFNGDAVNRVELTKGAYPARFGGRLGSVLDVRLRDGDLEQTRVQGQVGILSTRLLAEGPIVPGRASFLVSGRRTYADVVAAPFVARANRDARARGGETVDPQAYFYDLNAKVNWRVTPRDRVYLSLYGGRDVFGFATRNPVEVCTESGGCVPSGVEDRAEGHIDWGNLTAAARYTRIVSPRVFGALTLTASDYGFNVGADAETNVGSPIETRASARYRSGIRDVAARADLDVAAGREHAARLGLAAALHRFTPGALSLVGTAPDVAQIDTSLGASRTVGADLTAYAEDEWTVSPRLSIGAGVHGALYTSGGVLYPSLEPRLSVALRIGERLAVKASAATTQQPLHLLTSGAGIGLPADLWVPATARVGPERGTQVALGLAGSSASGRTTWTLDAYARTMRGLVAYRDGAIFSSPYDDWQDLVVTGSGRGAGLEVFVQHRTDRLSGWLGYTLARTDRQFDALNGGARFPFRYDRTHDVSAVGLWTLSRRFDLSAAWSFGTGDAVTLPRAEFEAAQLTYSNISAWANFAGLYGYASGTGTAYSTRNGFRLPPTHRLDLGATFYFRRGARPHALALNVYNAYNRKNTFLTQLATETTYDPETGRATTQRGLRGLALFPVLPTLSYQFAF